MKTKLLMKSLLVTAGLCMGASAWAYDVPTGMEVNEVLIGTLKEGNVSVETFDSESASVPSFTNSGKFVVSNELPTDQWNSLSSVLSGSALRLGSKTTHEIDFSSTLTSGQVVFSADFYIGTHAKVIKFIDENNNVVARFQYPDKNASNGRVYGEQYLFVDGDENAVFSSTPKMNDTYQGTRNREYQITEFVIDLDANKITYSGKLMDRRSSSNQWSTDNATITLSKDVSIKGMIIDASACGSETYYAYFDNMKLFSVGNAAGTHTYSVKAFCGDTELQTLGAGNTTEGAEYSVTGLPEVIVKNGNYYKISSSVENHSVSYTMGDSDETKIVEYTLDNEIVYFGEWETAYSTTSSNYGVTEKDILSGGSGRTIKRTDVTMNLVFTAPVAGKYQITMPYYNDDSKSRSHIIYLDGTEEANQLESKSVNSKVSGALSQEVALAAGEHTIYVKCTYNLTSAMDYLEVKLNAATVSVAADKEFATFNSDYALDFSAVTDVKAYTAKMSADGATVTFTKVTGAVPAHTGLLIRGAEKGASADVPVVANAADVDNDFIAVVDEDATVKEGFVLATVDGVQGFYKANSTAGTKVAKGKAYLPASGSARLSMSFGDEATGISEVRVATDDNAVYNLNGVRVAQPQKGLYIMNGKKVVVK